MKNTILKSLLATTLVATAFSSTDPFAAFMTPSAPKAAAKATGPIADPFAAFMTAPAPKKAAVDSVAKADHELALQQLKDLHAAALKDKTLVNTADLLDADINAHNDAVLAKAVADKTHHTDADFKILQDQAMAALIKVKEDLVTMTEEKDALETEYKLCLAYTKQLTLGHTARDILNHFAQTVGYADSAIDANLAALLDGTEDIAAYVTAHKAEDSSTQTFATILKIAAATK